MPIYALIPLLLLVYAISWFTPHLYALSLCGERLYALIWCMSFTPINGGTKPFTPFAFHHHVPYAIMHTCMKSYDFMEWRMKSYALLLEA